MWFLYGELFVLMLVPFAAGCLAALLLTRAVVRRTAQQVSGEVATEPPSVSGGTS